jgi:hypothetical protein
MEGDVERRITYFRYCGEVNTEKVLQAAKLRCEETGLTKVVIASETGRSALKALNIFKGTKIAIEAAVMATDAGEVDAGEEVVSCAGTYKSLDTALVVKTAYSGGFFKEFEVREIIAKPICRVKALPEYKYENWKGNLDQYYL